MKLNKKTERLIKRRAAEFKKNYMKLLIPK